MKLDKTSDESDTVVTSVKLLGKNRSKAKEVTKISENSLLIQRKKEEKRSKEIVKRRKTSDEDSSSSHRKSSPTTKDKDRSKSSKCKVSQSNHLDSDDGRYHKTVPLMTENSSGHKSDLATGSYGNKLSKKKVEEALTFDELRIK